MPEKIDSPDVSLMPDNLGLPKAEYEVARAQKWEREKGGSYYVMLADKNKRQAVLDFINNDYGRRFPVSAAADGARAEGIKIDFNNAAKEQKDVLLRILAQREWNTTGEEYFADHAYEPSRATEPLLKVPKPSAQKWEVLKGGAPKKPEAGQPSIKVA